MANSLIQFRIDEKEKKEAIKVCEKLGMRLPAYLRICTSRLIQEQGIPFSMKLETKGNAGILAMQKASKIAKEKGISEMSLDEINNEIKKARNK